MNLRRFPSLGLRDPAFLQAGGCGPAPLLTNDANTQCWYNASLSVLTVGTLLIGDLMDTTVNKASTANPNLNLQAANSNYRFLTYPNRTDLRGNAVASSENMQTNWLYTACTPNSATLITFLAQNGRAYQTVGLCEAGRTYTLEFWMRNVSGNTAIRIQHTNAASAAYTDINITGVLTKYTVTFTGPATGVLVTIAFQDVNAAGHGQLEVTYIHLRRDDHNATYVATNNAPYWGTRDGLPVWGGGGTGPTTHVYWGNVGGDRVMTEPFTFYMTYFPRWPFAGGYLNTCNHPSLISAVTTIQNSPNSYLGIYRTPTWRYGTVAVPQRQWSVLTFVFNGANSKVRVNKNTADTVNLPTPGNVSRTQHIGESYVGSYEHVGDMHELIIRSVADGAALQDSIIEWMGCQVGLSL